MHALKPELILVLITLCYLQIPVLAMATFVLSRESFDFSSEFSQCHSARSTHICTDFFSGWESILVTVLESFRAQR